MKKIAVLWALTIVCVGCFSSGYNVRMESETVKIVRDIGPKAMRDAIVKGGENREWTVVSEKPGVVTLSLFVRGGKHQVTVDVTYTGDSFAVAYRDSVGMEYDPRSGKIRGKYLNWVRNLKQDIRLAASRVQ